MRRFVEENPDCGVAPETLAFKRIVEVRKFHGRDYFSSQGGTRLLERLANDALAPLELCGGAIFLFYADTVLGDDGHNECGPKFSGLPHDEIEFLAFRQGLHKGDFR